MKKLKAFLFSDHRAPVSLGLEAQVLAATGVLHPTVAWIPSEACGYPERFSQQALGHASKAVHRAYAKHVQVTLPSREGLEQACIEQKIIPIRRLKGNGVEMSRVNIRRRPDQIRGDMIAMQWTKHAAPRSLRQAA